MRKREREREKKKKKKKKVELREKRKTPPKKKAKEKKLLSFSLLTGQLGQDRGLPDRFLQKRGREWER